ncbi:unnamed protein product [Kuraishia capsulata CBS 1993]|uniref:Vacuolar protein sorting-associated protein 28 n=1 Tax=Kuraishia capsulata CBS 1993 TaxID=1382522 RepID=W6MSK0_9ASCO|nr:uncharacterized protein KUCA_T00005774001 [Kuraishia capsulata CBS 1993]CDK29781.1 unnamed protein product [Kuraishia capsulata CBS 1993]
MDPQALPPYAPTPTLSRNISINLINSSRLPLNSEIQLYTSNKERNLYESLGEIYSIIIVLNCLEKAFIKDSLHFEHGVDGNDEYTRTVTRLLNQYMVLLKDEDVSREFGSLEKFCQEYKIDCPLAKSRINIGVPATVEHSISTRNLNAQSGSQSQVGISDLNGGNRSARAVAEATGNFITTMDAVKLNYRTKDQLHPLLSDLVTSINKVLNGKEFDGRSKLINWLIKLNNLGINDQLTDDDCKQLLFDLDVGYKGFYTELE